MASQLKLAIIGDPHLAIPQGADDPYIDCDPGLKLHPQSKLLFEAAIAAINAEPGVDAVLLLGDMTRDSELFNHKAAAELLTQLKVPHYVMLGNHDCLRERRAGVTYPNSPRLDREGYVEFWHGRGLPQLSSSYKVELPGEVDLVVLDTNFTLRELVEHGLEASQQDHGFITPERLDWLDAQLAETRQRGRLPLVAAHHSVMDQSPAERHGHPLLSIFGFWQVHKSGLLRLVLGKYAVPVVLSGHLHIQSVNEMRDGGAALTNIVTSALVSYPHGWAVLTVEDFAIRYESRSLAQYLPAGFIEDSRRRASEGIGALIRRELTNHPMLGKYADIVGEMVERSGWWTRLCDGTLAGFSVDPGLLPKSPLPRLVCAQAAQVLGEYGTWKTERADPNKLEIWL